MKEVILMLVIFCGFSTTVNTNDFDDGDFYRITVISSEQLTFVQH